MGYNRYPYRRVTQDAAFEAVWPGLPRDVAYYVGQCFVTLERGKLMQGSSRRAVHGAARVTPPQYGTLTLGAQGYDTFDPMSALIS